MKVTISRCTSAYTTLCAASAKPSSLWPESHRPCRPHRPRCPFPASQSTRVHSQSTGAGAADPPSRNAPCTHCSQPGGHSQPASQASDLSRPISGCVSTHQLAVDQPSLVSTDTRQPAVATSLYRLAGRRPTGLACPTRLDVWCRDTQSCPGPKLSFGELPRASERLQELSGASLGLLRTVTSCSSCEELGWVAV